MLTIIESLTQYYQIYCIGIIIGGVLTSVIIYAKAGGLHKHIMRKKDEKKTKEEKTEEKIEEKSKNNINSEQVKVADDLQVDKNVDIESRIPNDVKDPIKPSDIDTNNKNIKDREPQTADIDIKSLRIIYDKQRWCILVSTNTTKHLQVISDDKLEQIALDYLKKQIGVSKQYIFDVKFKTGDEYSITIKRTDQLGDMPRY
ncbi:MAG: hypothetical protein WC346_05170 [Methanogenium sp.]|jgi:hypothetical protein